MSWLRKLAKWIKKKARPSAALVVLVLVAGSAHAEWLVGPAPAGWTDDATVNVTCRYMDGATQTGSIPVMPGPWPAGSTRGIPEAQFVGSGKTITVICYAQRAADTATRSVEVSAPKTFPVAPLAPPALSVR